MNHGRMQNTNATIPFIQTNVITGLNIPHGITMIVEFIWIGDILTSTRLWMSMTVHIHVQAVMVVTVSMMMMIMILT